MVKYLNLQLPGSIALTKDQRAKLCDKVVEYTDGAEIVTLGIPADLWDENHPYKVWALDRIAYFRQQNANAHGRTLRSHFMSAVTKLTNEYHGYKAWLSKPETGQKIVDSLGGQQRIETEIIIVDESRYDF